MPPSHRFQHTLPTIAWRMSPDNTSASGSAATAPIALPPLSTYLVNHVQHPSSKPQPSAPVGSYLVPDWLQALPSEQALVDATRVVFDTQCQVGIDLPTDGELYRFYINHPDTDEENLHYV